MFKSIVFKSLSGFAKEKQSHNRVVTLFPGHGVGPEISEHVIKVFSAMKLPITFERHEIYTEVKTKDGDIITQDAIDSIMTHKFALKGPFATPIGKGYRSLNITLRKKFNLYANVRPCKTVPGIVTPYPNVDVVTIRENTEGEYSGLEHEVVPGVVENLKIISEKACRQIAEYAFKFASEHDRKKVTVCHKAAIM
mgnify:CR=1 FL=1